MVLSDIEIRAEIRAERLVFDPPISENSPRIDRSSVDLLLHEEMLLLPDEPQPAVIIDPDALEGGTMDILRRNGTPHSLAQGPLQLQPYRLVIGKTLEYIELPDHIAARIEGKSTLARFGLSVHVTAPTVIAGFQGNLYLEINNIGPFPIQLKKGMRIAQLILEHVGLPPSESYSGRYYQQR